MGRVFITHARKEKDIEDIIYEKDFEKGVPSVPTTETVSKIYTTTTETKDTLTVEKTCSKCESRAIPYVDSTGKYIADKCNVHGARLKVKHEDIDAYSRAKERNSRTESGNQ